MKEFGKSLSLQEIKRRKIIEPIVVLGKEIKFTINSNEKRLNNIQFGIGILNSIEVSDIFWNTFW